MQWNGIGEPLHALAIVIVTCKSNQNNTQKGQKDAF